MSAGTPIAVAGATLRYGARAVLDGLDLALAPGRIVGLIGPNGAGKSSLLRALNGALPLASGEIRFGDRPLAGLAPAARARLITYVGAELETDFPLTTREFVELGGFSFDRSASPSGEGGRLREAMEETGCWDHRDRALASLSSGERQRAHFARALFQAPEWVCLDESFSKLDLHHQAKLGALLRKRVARGTSFLFVSHDLNFTTDWADHCVLMREGRVLASGPTKEVVVAENLRKLYPDAAFELVAHPATGALKVHFRA